jgi:cobalt/nickel transport protein
MISQRTSLLLLIAVVLLIALPLIFVPGKFGGSDDAASEAIEASQPGYQPWFKSLWTPPGDEVESLLFAVQAAFGAGVIGYVLGRIHGAAKEREGQQGKS